MKFLLTAGRALFPPAPRRGKRQHAPDDQRTCELVTPVRVSGHPEPPPADLNTSAARKRPCACTMKRSTAQSSSCEIRTMSRDRTATSSDAWPSPTACARSSATSTTRAPSARAARTSPSSRQREGHAADLNPTSSGSRASCRRRSRRCIATCSTRRLSAPRARSATPRVRAALHHLRLHPPQRLHPLPTCGTRRSSTPSTPPGRR
jgi:hypothetical protein